MKILFAILVLVSLAACGDGSATSTTDSTKASTIIDSIGNKMTNAADTAGSKIQKLVDSADKDVKMMIDSSKK